MTKFAPASLENLESQASAIGIINSNFDAVADALENTLSRDGSTPNQMEADLDMNSKRILNLPAPQGSTDPVRLSDLQAAAVTGYVLPDIGGNEGKYLSNDGDVLFWEDVEGGTLLSENNLNDLDNVVTARTNLGLGTAALATVGTSGDAVGKLNASLTWSGTQAYSALVSFSGGWTLTGNVEARLNTTTLTTISTDSVGFRGVPVTVKDSDYTFVLNDSGRLFRHTSGTGHTWTIPPSVFPIGTVLVVRNVGSGAVSIACGVGVTLRADGTSSDANRSLGQWGYATITQEASNTWVITGTVLT